MTEQSLLDTLKAHQSATGRRDFRKHCTCGWFGELRADDFLQHQAEALEAAGYGKLPEAETEWGTSTKWGHRPSMSKQNALDYIELCKSCGDDAKLIKRRAAIAPGPWEPAE
jgi:hypothetical protein